MMMKLRDFRIGWRLLVQEPAYSAVVILGLAIGFATCFLLLGFVKHSLSYDRHVPQAERIYEVKTRTNFPGQPPQWGGWASLAIREAMLASGLDVKVTPWIVRTGSFRAGDTVQTIDPALVDADFQEMFNVQPLAGNLQAAISRPDGIALTVETARKMFGSLDVVGKTMTSGGQTYTVLALLPDPPSATVMPYQAVAGIKNNIFPLDDRINADRYTNWGSSNGGMYFKLGPGVTPEQVVQYLDQAVDRSPWRAGLSSPERYASGQIRPIEFKLGPLQEAYFDPDTAATADPSIHGNRQIVYGLAGVGILILLLAATNYVNLATVRTLRRQREIGVRKVLGASVRRVAGQFIAESVLVSALATAFGLLLAWLLLPVFADLVNRTLDDMFTPLSLSAALVLALVVGLASGAYPAWVAVHVRATQALAGRGSNETVGGLWLRRVLTVMQFATAMGLTGLTLAIVWQTQYASNLNPGFDPAPLVVVDLPTDLREAPAQAFKEALARLPGVQGVAASANPVARNWINNNSNFGLAGRPETTMNVQSVSPEFFDTYQLKPIAGRAFDSRNDRPDNAEIVMINRTGVRALGFDSPEAAVGQFINRGRRQVQVVGVVEDVRHKSLRSEAAPTIYRINPALTVLTVRAAGNVDAVQKEIEALWTRHYPNDVLNMNRAGSFIALQYAEDLRMAKLLTAAAFIAIAIAAFGIYVLSAYSVQRKAKQIVLRKLYGASSRDIGVLVGREFLALIGVGALIGLPLAGLAIHQYLASFVDRAPIGAWTLLTALVIALVVAFVSTLRHTVGAMRISPALALRS